MVLVYPVAGCCGGVPVLSPLPACSLSVSLMKFYVTVSKKKKR